MASVVFLRMASFAILLLVGAAAGKFHIIGRESLQEIISLVLKVLLPVMSFYLTYAAATREIVLSNLPILPLTAVFYAIIVPTVALLSRVLRLRGARRHVFQMIFVFGNTGFIGLPLLSSVLPDCGVVDVSLFVMVDQIVFWTYGAHLATPEGKPNKVHATDFLNPNILATLLAFVFVLGDVKLPYIFEITLSMLSGAASPLCMLCMGAMCYFSGMGAAFRKKELYAGIAVKMLAMPIAIGALLLASPLPHDLVLPMVLMSAMPTTTLVPLCVESRGGNGDEAAVMVVATVAASVLTIPLVVMLLGL